jgi:hypothetical protein
MLMIWSPEQLLLLAGVALAIAFFLIGEMIEQEHRRRPMRTPTESDRLARAMRDLPRASREDLRNRSSAGETKWIAPD